MELDSDSRGGRAEASGCRGQTWSVLGGTEERGSRNGGEEGADAGAVQFPFG